MSGGAIVLEEEVGRFDGAEVGMLIFLGAETMLFAGFVAAYLVFRLGAPVWPPPFQPRLPVGLTGVNTAVLLLSGCAMWRGRLGPTVLLGGAFVLLQGYEWTRLLAFGLTADSGVYGGTFYAVIGAHAVHALAGLGWLGGPAVAPRPPARPPPASSPVLTATDGPRTLTLSPRRERGEALPEAAQIRPRAS